MTIIYNISTFRPEQCGIASWTEDKIHYSHRVDPSVRNRVFAVNGFREKNEYPDLVDFCIDRDVLDDYFQAANIINSGPKDSVVSIQHEFGIFGGDVVDGKRVGNYIIDFMKQLKKPIVTTCHTVLDTPFDTADVPLYTERRKAFSQVLRLSDKVIAISETAKTILGSYDINEDKITVVPHGVHKYDESPEDAKKILGLEGRFVLSMVGLVRQKRGMEYVIQSLPPVVEKHPSLLFLISGKTHPKEISDGKEPYREYLQEEVRSLGLENNVRFVDRFLPLESLLRYIQASDICITPYTDPRQTSSGVLSYSVGLGKPVISTPFKYAKELLANNKGILLPDFHNPNSISSALLDILDHPQKRECIQKNIQGMGEDMSWDSVAKKYLFVEKSLLS